MAVSREEESIEQIFEGVFRVPDPKNPSKRLLATRNLTPGKTYYGEPITRLRYEATTVEFRFWDPFRSKLSAAVLKGLRIFPFKSEGRYLYLGASTGTTVSHISDIAGERGKIFGVELAARVGREFLQNVVKFRKNIVPIIADAREPTKYSSIYGKVSTVYCDIAQPDQTEIALCNCLAFLEKGGILMLVVKASSIDALKPKNEIFSEQRKILENSGFEMLQQIDLEPYDRNHAIMVAKMAT